MIRIYLLATGLFGDACVEGLSSKKYGSWSLGANRNSAPKHQFWILILLVPLLIFWWSWQQAHNKIRDKERLVLASSKKYPLRLHRSSRSSITPSALSVKFMTFVIMASLQTGDVCAWHSSLAPKPYIQSSHGSKHYPKPRRPIKALPNFTLFSKRIWWIAAWRNRKRKGQWWPIVKVENWRQ